MGNICSKWAVPIVAALAGLSWPLHSQTTASPPVRARVIVKLRSDSPLVPKVAAAGAPIRPMHAKALAARLGIAMDDGPPVAIRTQVLFADGMTSAELAQRLGREPDVEYAVPDERRHRATAPNDPLYGSGVPGNGPAVGQWYLRAPDATEASSINIEPAWSVTLGSPSAVVADIDTGVRFDHPDLLAVAAGGKLLPGYDMISDPRTANDGDGRDADASDPGDWVTAAEANDRFGEFFGCTTLDPDTNEYTSEDSSWHGTQISGIVGAMTNNGIGMAGVGPKLLVLPVRALGKCGGFDSDIIAGMLWAAGIPVPGTPPNPNPARVINLSLGGEGTCHAGYADAVNHILAAGTVIVASAGNDAGHAPSSPANCTGVIAVAGLRHAGTKVGFSNLGQNVTISAPAGNCVNISEGSPCLYPMLTASNAGTTTPTDSIYTDSFNASFGTSYSAPLVSGVVGLMLSVQPSLTPERVREVLQTTSRAFPTTGGSDATVLPCALPQFDASGNPVDQLECYCTTYTCGAGMLDGGAALSALASNAGPVSVVEYYWAAKDHYFITANPAEIAALDAAPPGGWVRTGQIFGAFAEATGISSRVCRFYIPPLYGDSHFFSASPDECASVQVKFPVLLEETTQAFYIDLPDLVTGACPAGTMPVYRLYNNRADVNHRYTTSLAIRSQMLVQGYIPEGYGLTGVAMCAPALPAAVQ
ncbi:MAG TPA: S8 family peptidase [Casimicrobiaceae bacterium]|nr:S8 family peptidase [Casimicrobiaceae bacterium]